MSVCPTKADAIFAYESPAFRALAQVTHTALTISLPYYGSIPWSSLEDTPPLPNALGPDANSALLFCACAIQLPLRDDLRRPHQTSTRRRSRRAGARSIDSMISPKGSIQNPRMGRKPTKPPRQSRMPRTIRVSRDAGTAMEKRPNFSRTGRLDDKISGLSNVSRAPLDQFDIAISRRLR